MNVALTPSTRFLAVKYGELPPTCVLLFPFLSIINAAVSERRRYFCVGCARVGVMFGLHKE
jgi:hypothetical protein